MAKPRQPINVKLFIAAMYASDEIFEKVKHILVDKFGEIDCWSAVFPFSYSQYYVKEMGSGLKKRLFSFSELIAPDTLPEIKLITNQIEDEFSEEGRRKINLDPGYLSAANVVMATAKNFDHRIYLGKGIFGDVQLRFRRKKFHFNPWTYPDFKDKYIIEFLSRVRKIYMKEYEKLLLRRQESESRASI